MATDPTAGPRTRRAVLAGAVASVAVLAADRLARPEVTEAASTAVMSEAINSTAAETDIYSSATDGTSALGCFAQNNGSGMWGSTNAAAPFARVHGLAYLPTGIGVRAANSSTSGTALQVEGTARFSRSGRTKVLAGHSSIDITVPGGLAGVPLIFANLMIYRTGVAVAAIRPNWPSAGKARIYLTKSVATAAYVSWLVVG
jgi:hypothetical protein